MTDPDIQPGKILSALNKVKDPDLNKDIVSLGLVKNLLVSGNNVSFEIAMTTTDSGIREQLRLQCESRVKEIEGIGRVAVRVVDPRQARPPNPGIRLPGVKNVIAVASGKGGVGKSTVAANLAVALAKGGASVGLLDADVYGPSMPLMFGLSGQPEITDQKKIVPKTAHGVRVMSMGFLANDKTPVIWRGPMVHSLIQQFLGSVEWGELENLIIDCPPGTGDAILTLTQSAPLTGAVIVTTPQEVSLIDARRGLKMFDQVKVPILGVIENMSYYECKHCNEREYIFRQGGGLKISKEENVPFLGEIPIDSAVVVGGDDGRPVLVQDPDSPASAAFRNITLRLREEIEGLGGSKPDDLSLTWR